MLYKYDKIDQNHMGQYAILRRNFKYPGNFGLYLLTKFDLYAAIDITGYDLICSITHISFCYINDSN